MTMNDLIRRGSGRVVAQPGAPAQPGATTIAPGGYEVPFDQAVRGQPAPAAPAAPPARSSDREAWRLAAQAAAQEMAQADPGAAFAGRTPTADELLAHHTDPTADFGGGTRGQQGQPPPQDHMNDWLRDSSRGMGPRRVGE